ncbi:MAG: dTDP-4-dehydrorhamnose 3,5-epimerase [Anaerolineae bacterium]|nr:dTDP-4-dehydrorhamnose 3,5-epimerase [Anaerolineae bacterium]MBT7192218.1 dTDP-4-dehydrorhamnose 3,5-epimerase [Anaerolineae bacterium]MBT7989635.1 dTDP-4-dehydrorhamnose 3,5-epimerase [Anaerolineae bacterium]
MIFREMKLKGAYIIELEPHQDKRGFFARSWDGNIFGEHGLSGQVIQQNISFNKKKGTMRGMHYQAPPYQETKLVRCVRGRIFDVIVDLRPDSPTFKEWLGVELQSSIYQALYVPKDFAHGFLTLEDNTEVTYLVTEVYTPEAERGLRYNDPEIGIKWPSAVKQISEKDASWPNFSGRR